MHLVKGKFSLYGSHSIAMCTFSDVCILGGLHSDSRFCARRQARHGKSPVPKNSERGFLLYFADLQAGQFIAAAILMSSSRTVAALYFPAAQ